MNREFDLHYFAVGVILTVFYLCVCYATGLISERIQVFLQRRKQGGAEMFRKLLRFGIASLALYGRTVVCVAEELSAATERFTKEEREPPRPKRDGGDGEWVNTDW